jgi:hypothetical protein
MSVKIQGSQSPNYVANVDQNYGLATTDAVIPYVTATWSSGTNLNTTLSPTNGCAGYGTMVVTANASGGISAGTIVFEVSDGSGTWWLTSGVRCGSMTQDYSYALVNGAQAWQIDVTGFTNFRVRLSVAIVGTSTVPILVQGSHAPSPQALVATIAPGSSVAISSFTSGAAVEIEGVSAANTSTLLPISTDAMGNLRQNVADQDIWLRILLELRVIREALTALACDGGKNQPIDFDPDQFDLVEALALNK